MNQTTPPPPPLTTHTSAFSNTYFNVFFTQFEPPSRAASSVSWQSEHIRHSDAQMRLPAPPSPIYVRQASIPPSTQRLVEIPTDENAT
ncbi:MAG: hypothetical protein Q9200_006959 [Gallowayella weberi]